MTDIELTSELLQALKDIQAELQQMNKTLGVIATKNKQASGETESRPFAGRSPRPAGKAYRSESRGPGDSESRSFAGRSPRAGKPYRSEKSEGSSDKETGFRSGFPSKKSPCRPAGKLPPKKGSGYPKKPR